MRKFVFCALAAMWPVLAHAGTPDCSTQSLRRAIAGLAALELRNPVYVDDGAADGSAIEEADGWYKAREPIAQLLRCSSESAPLLIEHLDDTTMTRLECESELTHKKYGGRVHVPIGYVCLDLLEHMTFEPQIHETDCADDGWGACIKPEFYFRPDSYSRINGKCVVTAQIRKVKRAWARALKSGKLHFRNPLLR